MIFQKAAKHKRNIILYLVTAIQAVILFFIRYKVIIICTLFLTLFFVPKKKTKIIVSIAIAVFIIIYFGFYTKKKGFQLFTFLGFKADNETGKKNKNDIFCIDSGYFYIAYTMKDENSVFGWYNQSYNIYYSNNVNAKKKILGIDNFPVGSCVIKYYTKQTTIGVYKRVSKGNRTTFQTTNENKEKFTEIFAEMTGHLNHFFVAYKVDENTKEYYYKMLKDKKKEEEVINYLLKDFNQVDFKFFIYREKGKEKQFKEVQ